MRWLAREWRLFWTAVSVLTRLPTPRLDGFTEDWLPRSAVYFPLVGLLVGLLAGAAWWLAMLVWPAAIAALAAVAVAAGVTGGLHEDGWADLFDALAASRERERMLAVMKDSHIGAVGALALVLLVAGKLAALTTLPTGAVPAALVAAHVLSRWSHLPLLWRLPYVRAGGGLTGALAGRVPAGRLAAGTVLALALAALALGRAALPAALAAAVAAAAAGLLFRHRLGGVTGDCLGAANQLVELGTLLVLLATPAITARWPPLP